MACGDEILPDGTIKPLLVIKQGETFKLSAQYTEDDGITPKSLIGVVLESQIRDTKDALVATLSINITNSVLGLYEIFYAADTTLWTPGIFLWDIKENVSGVIKLTTTERILVEKSQTRIGTGV